MSWFSNLFNTNKKRIYLDYAAATPVLPEVANEMAKYFSREFYNPSAIYQEGLEVKNAIEDYRSRIAKTLGAGSKEIIFTAGGTESVNLAILGAFEKAKEVFKKPHIIISSIEHPAVVRAAEEVARRGGELTVVDVDEEGIISFEALGNAIKKNTCLISVGLANSEIGSIQPISKIGRLAKSLRKERESAYPLLHTDASAGAAYLPIALESLQVDMLTLDAAKIYGPKGSGILALRRGVEIHPVIFGGEQERGRRAGTPNAALIAGFSKALEVALRDRESETERLESLRYHFIERVIREVPQAIINGSKDNHLPNILSISIPNTLSEFILLKLDKEGVMVSVGSACSLDERESGSPIIKALGKSTLKESTIRISLGRTTSKKDCNRAVNTFCRVVANMVK